jgi:uncharacterized membrane protein
LDVTVILMLIIAWLSSEPSYHRQQDAMSARLVEQYAGAEGFEEVQDIILGRCSMCHSAEPVYGNLMWAPNGVLLETPEQIAALAQEIYLQAGASHAMPPANVSFMEDEERARIVAWFKAARG